MLSFTKPKKEKRSNILYSDIKLSQKFLPWAIRYLLISFGKSDLRIRVMSWNKLNSYYEIFLYLTRDNTSEEWRKREFEISKLICVAKCFRPFTFIFKTNKIPHYHCINADFPKNCFYFISCSTFNAFQRTATFAWRCQSIIAPAVTHAAQHKWFHRGVSFYSPASPSSDGGVANAIDVCECHAFVLCRGELFLFLLFL